MQCTKCKKDFNEKELKTKFKPGKGKSFKCPFCKTSYVSYHLAGSFKKVDQGDGKFQLINPARKKDKLKKKHRLRQKRLQVNI